MVRSAYTMAATYRDDFGYLKRPVAAIGLQDNLAAALHRIVDVREPPSGRWAFADEINVI